MIDFRFELLAWQGLLSSINTVLDKQLEPVRTLNASWLSWFQLGLEVEYRFGCIWPNSSIFYHHYVDCVLTQKGEISSFVSLSLPLVGFGVARWCSSNGIWFHYFFLPQLVIKQLSQSWLPLGPSAFLSYRKGIFLVGARLERYEKITLTAW